LKFILLTIIFINLLQPLIASSPLNNIFHTNSRLAFSNQGGLINGGVCWWHSRLQRAVFYLAKFNPTLPPPDKKQLKVILRNLRYFKQVVVIPGFANFYDFSKTYHKEIQTLLEKWQLSDGFIYFQWIRGLSGSTNESPEKYLKRMHKLYLHIKTSKYIKWTMLQLPGISSHALLILDMKLVGNNEYEFLIIDSNYSLETKVISTKDQPALYLGFHTDIDKIKKVRNHQNKFLLDNLR
jgi:hypothetical protein